MSDIWPMVPLADVCEFLDRRGVTPKKLGSDFIDSGYRVISAKNIKGRTVNLSVGDQRYVDDATYRKWMASPLFADDVLLTSEAPLGEPAYLDEDREWCLGQRLFCLRSDKTRLFGRFLFHAFQSPIVRGDMLSRATGATAQGIRQAELRRVAVPIPKVTEQKRIVAILDEAFGAIDRAKRIAEINLSNAILLFESYLNRVFAEKGEGWEETTVGEICKSVEYGTSSKSTSDGDVPVLRMGNIQNREIDWADLKYSSESEEIEKYSLRDGDVLFNRTNSAEHVGKTCIYRGDRPAIFAGYLIRVHYDRERVDGEFLNYYLNSDEARDYGKTIMSRSVNQANINGTKLKGYKVPLAPLDKQRNIVSQFNALNDETSKIETICRDKLANLDELKQSILQKAFTGQLTAKSPELEAVP